ncbi:MAG: phage tail tape measure protein [Alphaproteobacteria bacterium]|nr:phage tail tape measure protein [Alphaproteobacteria bacterium]
MADILSQLDALDGQIGNLETTIGSAQTVSAAFQGELKSMETTMSAANRQVSGLTRSVGWGLRRAFDGLVFDGAQLSDVLKSLGRSMVSSVFSSAFKPVQNTLAQALTGGVQSLIGGLLPFQNGAAFSSGKVTPFARGGVISSATPFQMQGGLGVMGEAGPEAIMPLTRGADGKLGVKSAQGGRAVTVTMNISTPDLAGFHRSRSQIASQMSRAIARASRNN